MKKEFDIMVSRKDLVQMGFKPSQASQMIKEAKVFLVEIEGVAFYNNRQISVVPARTLEKLFHLKFTK